MLSKSACLYICEKYAVCVCECVYEYVCVCGDRGSRLIDEIGRSLVPCLFDELVGSLICFTNAKVVHVRLKEKDERGEKGQFCKDPPYFLSFSNSLQTLNAF